MNRPGPGGALLRGMTTLRGNGTFDSFISTGGLSLPSGDPDPRPLRPDQPSPPRWGPHRALTLCLVICWEILAVCVPMGSADVSRRSVALNHSPSGSRASWNWRASPCSSSSFLCLRPGGRGRREGRGEEKGRDGREEKDGRGEGGGEGGREEGGGEGWRRKESRREDRMRGERRGWRGEKGAMRGETGDKRR